MKWHERVAAFAAENGISPNLADAALALTKCPPRYRVRSAAVNRAIADYLAGWVPSDERGATGTLELWFDLIQQYDAELPPRLSVIDGGLSRRGEAARRAPAKGAERA
jgi:hypothetical protein